MSSVALLREKGCWVTQGHHGPMHLHHLVTRIGLASSFFFVFIQIATLILVSACLLRLAEKSEYCYLFLLVLVVPPPVCLSHVSALTVTYASGV